MDCAVNARLGVPRVRKRISGLACPRFCSKPGIGVTIFGLGIATRAAARMPRQQTGIYGSQGKRRAKLCSAFFFLGLRVPEATHFGLRVEELVKCSSRDQ